MRLEVFRLDIADLKVRSDFLAFFKFIQEKSGSDRETCLICAFAALESLFTPGEVLTPALVHRFRHSIGYT